MGSDCRPAKLNQPLYKWNYEQLNGFLNIAVIIENNKTIEGRC